MNRLVETAERPARCRPTEPAGPPLIVFHYVIDPDSRGDIEICIPVPADMDIAANPTGPTR